MPARPKRSLLVPDFRIANRRVQPSLNIISGPGGAVHIEPKVMQVLVLLAEHAGEVVSKERLLRTVWADTFVGDDVLTRAISELRRVFDDDPKAPRVIQTIPKGGYRLIAPVAGVDELARAEQAAGSRGMLRTAAPTFGPRPMLVVVVAVALLVAAAALWFRGLIPVPAPPSAPSTSMRTVPFTSLPGAEVGPAFSPDGERIAFSWGMGSVTWKGSVFAGEGTDIYVKQVGVETLLRLTTDPAPEFGPVWSPDGRQLAFIRIAGERSGIFVIPALGGPERKIHAADWPSARGVCWSSPSWSPDGRFVAFPSVTSKESCSIFRVSMDTLLARKLTSPTDERSDSSPAFSPDGRTLAFVRYNGGVDGDIHLMAARGGEARRVTFGHAATRGRLAWSADSRAIVFASNREGLDSLWRVSVAGGTPEPLGLGEGFDPAIDRAGRRLSYVRESLDTNIWALQRGATGAWSDTATRLSSSTRLELSPQVSPDGSRMAFSSDVSGSLEIWVSAADGSNAVRLTSFGGPLTGSPRWSPDSRFIVFDSTLHRQMDIYVINAQGGAPRRLTSDPAQHFVPSWSRDGRRIYFTSGRSGRNELWSMPAEGGPSVQLTTQGALEGHFESGDGRFIYYSTGGSGRPGIWRIPVDGGQEVPVLHLSQVQSGYWGTWALVDDGIYFINNDTPMQPSLEFFRFATRRIRRIATLRGPVVPWESNLAVAPDGRRILYSQMDQFGTDVMLVENFR